MLAVNFLEQAINMNTHNAALFNGAFMEALNKTVSSDQAATKTRHFKVVKEHLYSNLKGEAVILNLKNGKYYGLNSVGVSIWAAMQNFASFQEILNAVERQYDVDTELCYQEVSAFLNKMVEEGLIEISDEKPL